LLGIVEAVVRRPESINPTKWDRDDAILDAARQIGKLKPDLYKAEVPQRGIGDSDEIKDKCEEITKFLPCPWVVLSSGVQIEQFPVAVELACQGGASGFLAGRGIWQDAVRTDQQEYHDLLQSVSIQRLRQLCEIVDRNCRPWYAVIN
jgi:sulfofructosephosphate aldolase